MKKFVSASLPKIGPLLIIGISILALESCQKKDIRSESAQPSDPTATTIPEHVARQLRERGREIRFPVDKNKQFSADIVDRQGNVFARMNTVPCNTSDPDWADNYFTFE